MSHVDAQETLASLVKKLSSTTVCYWWKLLGDDHNSLCHLLDVSAQEMRLTLRKCRILYGDNDSFRTSEFEKLMLRIGVDYSTYRPKGKPEYFLKIGAKTDDSHAVLVPKDMHSIGGILEQMPVVGVHLPGIRTKVSRRLASDLVAASIDTPTNVNETPTDKSKPTNKGSMTIYVTDLINVIKKELQYASRMGKNYAHTQRAERMLCKAAAIAIKGPLRDMVDAWVEAMEDGDIKEAEAFEECLSTPAVGTRGLASAITNELPQRRVIFPGETPVNREQQQPLITPPLDLTDDVEEEEDESDINIVLTELKEETLLQNLLHKRIMVQNQRVLTLEHKNGRKFKVVVPPEAQSPNAFVEEAKRSRWIIDMLHTEVHRRGMLQYLAATEPRTYLRVANQKKIRVNGYALNTPQTLALGRLTGINGTQMGKLRSFLKNVGKAELKLTKKEIERIDHDVGLHKCTPPPMFNSFTLEWSTTRGNNVDKKPPEKCECWNCELLLEVAAEIDLLLHAIFLDKPGAPVDTNGRRIPLLDYNAPGFDDSPGIVVLFGGDHGAGACPCHLKLNFSSPEERKLRGELNYHCPTIQIASIDCTKDSLELLSNTAMPRLKQQLVQLRNSSAIVVYSYKEPVKYRKAFLVPKNCALNNMVFENNNLRYQTGANERTILLSEYFDFTADDLSLTDLRATCIITNFNDLYVGDLAFLAMAIGMNNSAGAHCIQCVKKASDFNCDVIRPEDVRTKASLTACLNRYNTLRLTNKGVQNHKGVNTVGLLDIDPQRIIVPILHCPMGLVDKVLEAFKAWTTAEVENLTGEAHNAREAYRIAKEACATAAVMEVTALQQCQQAGNTPALLALHRETKTATKEAKSEQQEAKTTFDEMVKRHNARLVSLSQSYDTMFRSHQIKKEHYHGGKYNGVNCIRIMEKADVLFEAFAATIKEKKVPHVTDEAIDNKCGLFARLLGLLDAIWSNVRGIDAGLLPTAEQIQHLRNATSEAKALWLAMGIGNAQPKWHLTIDGHLLSQVIKCGGLADKSDDTIEFQHQTLMKLRDRYRSVTSYQRRETCIRQQLRRMKSPEIQSHVDKCEASIKVKKANKRAVAATKHRQEQRELKRVKREAVLQG